MDLTILTAAEAARLLQSREIGALEYTEACLARIAAREEEVQAWTYLDADNARAQARAADARMKAGERVGPLHGLPVGIKDVIDTADMPTEHGSPAFKGNQPTADASCIAALRDAGAIIMGKTVTTELATQYPGKTRNPFNPAHTPGGSSSGSGAAVGCGMVPLALGTQTGGSVIRPASFNGIWGLKPTLGLISRTGVLLQSHTLDTVGVYGRSVEDLALITDSLAAHDPSDAVSYPRAAPRLLDAVRQDLPAPPRLAFFKTPVWEEGEPCMHAAFAKLVAELGGHVEEVGHSKTFAGIKESHRIVFMTEDSRYYGPLVDRTPDLISKSLTERIKIGNAITARTYLEAVAAREVYYAEIEGILKRYTALLVPSSPGPAPKGLHSTGNSVFNSLWTLLGVPCVSIPLFTHDSLPFGAQLVGRRREEGKLLATARWLSRHLGRAEKVIPQGLTQSGGPSAKTKARKR